MKFWPILICKGGFESNSFEFEFEIDSNKLTLNKLEQA